MTVLQRIADDLPSAERFHIDRDTVIMGDGGVLDSLGLANFIVGIEEEIEQRWQLPVALSDDDLMGLFEEGRGNAKAFALHLFDRLKR